MDIDPDISYWILNFLLRKPLNESTFKTLISTLPLPNDKPQLKVLILLKKLQFYVSGAAISLDLLKVFELLEEVLFRIGDVEVLESMKRAYCAVAVKCTVQLWIHVSKGGKRRRKFKFFETVMKVWRKKIGRMQKLVNVGLGSNELWVWKEEIESAVWEESDCDNLVKKAMAIDAVEAVSVYIREENERLRAPFIQLMADMLKDDENLKKLLEMGVNATEVGGKSEISPRAGLSGQGTDARNNNREVRKNIFRSRRKRPRLNHSRGVKITDPYEETVQPTYGGYKFPSSAKYARVREALESCLLELKAVVMDPLPDALRLAETLSKAAGIGQGNGSGGVNHAEANVFTVDTAGTSEANVFTVDVAGTAEANIFTVDAAGTSGANIFTVDTAGIVNAVECNENTVPIQNLMEHNSTSRTHERDASNDNSRPDAARYNIKSPVPVPPSIPTSPPKELDSKKFKQRRIRKVWTPLEEDTLRTGVKKFGKGSWKYISMFYEDIFVNRTEVDLKDKWRNLTRR